MIWIATLCLLAIAAWLFLNALNERRWVEAHSHDEGVAADPGFLPDFSRITARMGAGADGKVSIDQEDSRFARAVKSVQERTGAVGERIERAAAAGRERDDSETFFGRMVDKVGGTATRLDEKLDERVKRQSSPDARPAEERDGTGTFFERTVARVSSKQDALDDRVRDRVARKNATERPAAGAADEEGFFGTMVGRVSKRLDGMERRIDRKIEQARVAPGTDTGLGGEGDDFIARASAKYGTRINDLDEKIVDASKAAAERIDRKTDL